VTRMSLEKGNEMGERVIGSICGWMRIHPGITLSAVILLALVCIRERRIIAQTMTVIAVVATVTAVAVIVLLAVRWCRYLAARKKAGPGSAQGMPAAGDDIDFEPSVDWEAAFARLDQENGSR
jgi:hypothetical protein